MEEHHYTENQLQRLIGAEAANSDVHLKSCRRCKAQFDFLATLSAGMKAELVQPQHPNIERFADVLLTPRHIALSSFNARPDYRSLGTSQHALLLAAQHQQKKIASELCVATYASQETKTLVRVLAKSDASYELHTLSEQQERMRHILIRVVNDDGVLATVATDGNGVAQLDRTLVNDWNSTRLVALLPFAEIPCPNGVFDGFGHEANSLRLRATNADGHMNLNIMKIGEGVDAKFLLCILDNESSELHNVSSHSVVLTHAVAERLTALLLFD